MKAILFSLIALLFTVNSQTVSAGGKKEKVTIKTSAQCDECVGRITKSLENIDGVKSVSFDEAKNVTITYDATKTNADVFRSTITSVGYDADDKPANEQAYTKLPTCCKKPSKTE